MKPFWQASSVGFAMLVLMLGCSSNQTTTPETSTKTSDQSDQTAAKSALSQAYVAVEPEKRLIPESAPVNAQIAPIVEQTSPPETSAAAVPVNNALDYQKALEEIDALEADADFFDAYQKVQQLYARVEDQERRVHLRNRMAGLMNMRREADPLRTSLHLLGTENLSQIAVAKRKLSADGGEVVKLLLRREIRKGSAARAGDAAEVLAELNDGAAFPEMLQRYRQLKDGEAVLRSKLVASMKELARFTEPQYLMSIFKELENDKQYLKKEYADVLVGYYKSFHGSRDAFNQGMSAPDAFSRLQAYIKGAGEQSDERLQQWSQALAADFELHRPGMLGRYFEGVNFETLVFQRRDTHLQFDTSNFNYPDKRTENISIRWDGFIQIEKEGTYTFYSASDDGQRLWVADKQLIDNWNHQGVTEQQGTIELKPGLHPLRVEYFQGGGGAAITVSYSGPGIEKQVLTEAVLRTLSNAVAKGDPAF